MLRCKLNGILALFLFFIFTLPEHTSYSLQDKPVLQDPFSHPGSSAAGKYAATSPLIVTASVYYPEISQTDSTPLITADGSRINQLNPRRHRWVALSRNLLKRWGGNINYGDSILVTGISKELDGIYIVRDSMNKRLKNRLDILVGRKDKITGKWGQVQITRLNRPTPENFFGTKGRLAGAMVSN